MTDYCPGAVQVPQSNGGGLDTSLPPRAVWHITWDALKPDGSQPEFSAVANYLKNQQYCPHLMWNPFTGYIEQYYPASQSARALAAWNGDGAACVQIEVFFTPGCVVDGVKYNTVAETPLKGFGTILSWLDGLGIPRTWPMGAPQWSGNSRDVDIWNAQGGHYGHCNVPDNTHTDPGPMPALTGSITLQSKSTTPVQEDDDMALFTSLDDFKQAVSDAVQASHTVTRTNVIETLTENTEAQHVETRKQILSVTQAQQDVTRGYLADRVKDASPSDLVAAIPDNIAQQVLDGLTARLSAAATTGEGK